MSDPAATKLRARKTNGAANDNGHAAAEPVNVVRVGNIPTEYGKLMDKKLDVHQS